MGYEMEQEFTVSQEHHLPTPLEAAQAQIHQLSQQLALERVAAHQAQAHLQDQLEQQQQYIAELEAQTEYLRRLIAKRPGVSSEERAHRENENHPITRELQPIAAENRQSRQSFMAQEATYRHLFECNPQPMWVYDLETLRFLAVNDAAMAKYGYARAEFLAMTMTDIRPAEEVPRLLDDVAQVDGGDEWTGLWRHRLRDGRIIQVEVTSHALEFEGRPAELVMAQDVTQRLESEQALQALNLSLEQAITDRTAALRKSQAELQTILNSSPVKFYVEDLDGRYIFVNQTFLNGLHLEAKDVLGKTPYDLFPAEVADGFRANEQRLLAQGGVQQFEETVQVDGKRQVYWSNKFLLRDDQGNVYALCGVSTDITERKVIEEELQNSRDRLQAMLAALPDLVFRINRQGQYLDCYIPNDLIEISGLDSEALVGRNFKDCVPADIAEVEHCCIEQALNTRSVQQREQAVWIRGALRYQEARVAPCGEDEVILVVRDVTERKHMENDLRARGRALQDSQAFLQTVLETVPIAVFWKDLQGVYQGANSKTIEVFGLASSSELIQHTDAQLAWPPEVVENIQAEDRQIRATQAPYLNIVQHLFTPTGEETWLEINKVPLRDGDGTMIGILGIVQNITDRKLAEVELQSLTNRLSLALQAGQLGVWNWDLDQRLVWDVQLCQLYGLPATQQQTSWQDWRSQIHHADIERVEALLQAAIAGQPYTGVEFRIWRTDGELRWIQSFAQVQHNDQGNPVAMVGLNRDITRRKRAELNLQRTNQELARATRLKDEFLATMSHELRTPLNAILGMTEGLQEEVFGPLTDHQRRSLNTIERSGNHLLSLINDILDLSKIEAGQLDLDLAPVSVDVLCNSSLAFVKQQAHKKHLQLEAQIPARLPNLYGDERRLRQVLINLLSNAVKFTPAAGRVTITVCYSPLPSPPGSVKRELMTLQGETVVKVGTLTVAVADTGIGIRAEDAKRLFQPFVQIDSALNRQHQGTGLGLALVKRITEMHGGTVEFTSEVGGGSCFTVQLPVVALPADNSVGVDVTVAVEVPTALNPATAPLILLVEDNEVNINTTTAYLTAKGYYLVVARNGTEALSLAQTTNPDLILMDIQMPEINGLEAIRQMRQIPTLVNVPIIAITALAMPEDRERCLAAGANEYISKPIRLKHLDQTIQALLARLPP
jgi:PAS domain S-box-containing protein